MIKINLLPVRAERRKEAVKLQLIIAAAITGVVVIVAFGILIFASSLASDMNDKIARDKKELADLKIKTGALSTIEAEKKAVQEKLDTVKMLEEAKTGPVELFRVLSETIPERIWLNKVNAGDKELVLKGYSPDKRILAEFMKKLEAKEKYFDSVELQVTSRADEKESKVEVENFELRLKRVLSKSQLIIEARQKERLEKAKQEKAKQAPAKEGK